MRPFKDTVKSFIKNKHGRGLKYERFPSPYIVDFVCFEKKLVVEVDGGQHCQNQSDSVRDEWFS
ncbi:MAG: DUF559 domain-containing protein, partial [Candidatus Omnitrophota bacterium]